MATVGTQLPQDVPQVVPMADLSFRAAWASRAIKRNLGEIEKDAPGVPTDNEKYLLPAKGSEYHGTGEDAPLKVGIVGAGVAGLFTAMLFDYLKQEFGLDVTYEILEADDRVGGRLYSHYFKEDPDHPLGPHDYYDVGAMRFPEIKIMERTFQLFDELKMQKEPKADPAKQITKGSLVPYYFKGLGQPAYFNGVQRITRHMGQKVTANDFRIETIPQHLRDKDAGELVECLVEPFRKVYGKGDPQSAKAFWKKVLDEADGYTVRQYMTREAGYDYNTIEFLETMNYGNRWYDQAFSECIMESMDFDAKADWWCVEGGSAEIANRIHERLRDRDAVKLKKVVRKITYVGSARERVGVSVAGEAEPRVYDAVINSATLGAMQHMQLEGLCLNWGTKQAIRSLGYGASCKVGIRFRELWWIKEGIKTGGQGRTDLPIGTCVYPSYNIHDDPDKPGVLLVSYTWSQQAERIGALINRESPEGEDQLKEVLIHDLARLHARSDDPDASDYRRLHRMISDLYITHHAYDWYSNPRTAGAFAYFGPEQFRNMYQWVIRNDGKHIIVGEAASAHHAWVVGALESAVRGVYQFAARHSRGNKAACEVARAYEGRDEKKRTIRGPFGPLPAEYCWTDDILTPPDAGLTPENLPPAQGGLARLGVLFETIRLKDEEPKDRITASAITHEMAKERLELGNIAENWQTPS